MEDEYFLGREGCPEARGREQRVVGRQVGERLLHELHVRQIRKLVPHKGGVKLRVMYFDCPRGTEEMQRVPGDLHIPPNITQATTEPEVALT